MKSWEGSSVLVTGADGFIGSHLVEALARLGCEVHALAAYSSFGTSGWLDSLNGDARAQVRIHRGDVRDPGFITTITANRDIVFHLAALIAIPYSYQAPESFVDTNVRGTLNVLEAARSCETPKVVVTSTSEVYGTPESVPITLRHPLKAQSPYAATKIAADQLALAYAAAFGVNAAILRPFNTYGPRQSLRAVIPTVLAQMLSGADQIHLGSLHPQRDFTFVSDTVDGFIRIGSHETAPGEVVQLGTGVAASIGEIVRLCRDLTGSTAVVVEDSARTRPESSEVQVLLSDPSHARERIGWEPTIDLEEGLRRTAGWLASRGPMTSAAEYHR